MFDWWESLNAIQRFFMYVAIPSTVVLVIQTVLSIIGIGGDSDIDVPQGDFDVDIPDGDLNVDDASYLEDMATTADFRFFSIRGVVAFLTVFGWSGAAVYDSTGKLAISLLVAVIGGTLAMLVIALLFYSINKLQATGNVEIKNAIDKIGEVYLTIPANKSGTGKVSITVQERYREFEAMTEEENEIPTGVKVKVCSVIDNSTVLIKRL